jgi:type III restriction enzyme
MKLKFKQQGFQTDAVTAVADCFLGQPISSGITCRIDPGREVEASGQMVVDLGDSVFKNNDLALPLTQVLANIHGVQQRQNLPLSTELKRTAVCDINLDIEMETGTGKTYCYIKTMFELNRRYAWSKFIVVVPSIAIREGVDQTFRDTTDRRAAGCGL